MAPFRPKCICLLLLFLPGLGIPGIAGADLAAQPEDADAIQAGMEQVIAALDAAGYAKSVSSGEHVVIAYQQAQNREPTPEEFFMLSGVTGHLAFKPSEVLATALRGNAPELGWDRCRAFLATGNFKEFKGNNSTREIAGRLAEACHSRILENIRLETRPDPGNHGPREHQAVTATPNETYTIYFGYIHAHSALSDGNGTAEEAYTYARDRAHLDYFALTDHAEHLVFWPWETKWDQLKDAADAAYAPGAFVTLWGFEWSHPLLGHVNVLNSTNMTSVLTDFYLPEFYGWLSHQPEAFGLFNHPGRYDDLGIEFRRLQYFPEVAAQMAGIEVANKNNCLERYYYAGSWETEFSYYDEGNRQGWELGPVIGQDNHEPDWGTKNPWRTAVLARELTRESIIDAYRHRRFYATEDPGLHLDFRCAGYPMGSSLPEVPAEFTVDASTDNAAAFEQLRLFRNGELLETRSVSGNPVHAVFSDPAPKGNAWYYLIVTESVDRDGNGRKDEAITAPVWIGEPAPIPTCGASSLSCVAGSHYVGDLALFSFAMVALLVLWKITALVDGNTVGK